MQPTSDLYRQQAANMHVTAADRNAAVVPRDVYSAPVNRNRKARRKAARAARRANR